MCSDNDLTNFDKLRMNGRYSAGLRYVAIPVRGASRRKEKPLKRKL